MKRVTTASLLLGLAVLPIVLISATALMVDISSSADSGRVVPGLGAVLGGAALGLFALRLSRAVVSGLSCLAAAAVRFVAVFVAAPVSTHAHSFAFGQAHIPVLAIVAQPGLRRGPPQIVR